MPLNFGGRKRSGAFDTVWPPAIASHKYTLSVKKKKPKERVAAGGSELSAIQSSAQLRADTQKNITFCYLPRTP